MQSLEGFIERTQACETEQDLFREFDEFIRAFGLSHSAYFIMSKQLRAIPPETGIVRQNFPKEFAKEYISKNFAKFDPIIVRSRKESRPFHWGDVPKSQSLNSQQQQVFEAHKKANFLDGIAVPVFGPMGTMALFSLASQGAKLDLSANQEIEIQFACLQTHNRYFDLADINDEAPEKPLSPRETSGDQCQGLGLSWA